MSQHISYIFRQMFKKEVRDAASKARAFVDNAIPGLKHVYAELHGDEATRWVFLVFYKTALPPMPTPYKIIAIARDSDVIRELTRGESEPYQLLNYK